METVREVMLDCIREALTECIETITFAVLNKGDKKAHIEKYTIKLTDIAFSKAGISEKEQEEEW